MLAAPFYMGTGIYGFYAAQPYLLDLFGDQQAIGIAGIAAAGIAATQVAGGFAVPYIRRAIPRRTHVLLGCALLTAASLVLMGLVQIFAVRHRIGDAVDLFAQIERDDVGALLREPNRVAAALAARRARDEGDLALELSCHAAPHYGGA